MDELKSVLEVFGQARELFKAEPIPAAVVGPAPDAELWERVAINLSGQVAPTLNAIAGLVAAFKGQPAPPISGASGMPPAPISFDPYKDSTRMREFVRSQNTAGSQPAASAAAPAAPGAGSAPSPADTAADPIAAQVILLVNQALSCSHRGIDGHQCAAAFLDLNGELPYEALVQQIKTAGIPLVLEMAKQVPEISPQVVTFEQPLRRFIGEFLDGPEYADDEPAAAAVG